VYVYEICEFYMYAYVCTQEQLCDCMGLGSRYQTCHQRRRENAQEGMCVCVCVCVCVVDVYAYWIVNP